MEARQNLQGISLVGASVVIWGMGGLFTRLLPFDLWTIIFWRGVFAVPFVGLYAYWRLGGRLGREVTAVSRDGVIVCLCILATITLFPAAFQATSVAKGLHDPVGPALRHRGDRLGVDRREAIAPHHIAASLVALIGVFIMVGPFTGGLQTGDLLAAAGTVAQALATVTIRRNPRISMLPKCGWRRCCAWWWRCRSPRTCGRCHPRTTRWPPASR